VPIVLDASVAASWHFEDERSEGGDAILESLSGDGALVPPVWWFEVRNVILLAERNKRTTEGQTSAFLELLSRLPISVATLPNDTQVMGLARKHRLTFYDASYLELAQREGIGLATFDKELVKAARIEGVPLRLAAP
jgi:predicted nucleic acid-binding protein